MGGRTDPTGDRPGEHYRTAHSEQCRRTMGTYLASSEPRALGAFASERLGLEVQSISLALGRARGTIAPRVWEIMTPGGFFWLVEDGVIVELFPATRLFGAWKGTHGRGPHAAARRFLNLHAACRICDDDRDTEREAATVGDVRGATADLVGAAADPGRPHQMAHADDAGGHDASGHDAGGHDAGGHPEAADSRGVLVGAG
ncbi:MAG: hypothetical protein IT305_01815 [Chloroflexi bacterium]|nr:hypothetical protein [Chloroflexota bacterium]